ncbi:MAG: ATP-binding protein, partial [Elusimicrobiaceae bacterium]|nr:ATP-binding protein [Elusimicrobiaceae bacterium]
PGTGKTSFAKLLAKTARLMLYPAGVCNEGEEERNYRLQQLYRKQCLLEKIDNTCILFDEGEDIFSSLETRTSKMEINNLLENNEVPVIWTTNKIHRMDPAFIRRFTLAVCFNKPPVEVRQKIWNKYLTENKITCGKEDTLKLAKKYEVPPSMIAGAAQAAHMAKGDLNTVKEHLSFMTQALNGGYKKPEENTENAEFETALINADMNLDLLTQQIKRLGRLNFSLCLYGASGTGKSAYARYLAQELGLDVLHRRASDLLSKWVGGTEQNIAEAFAQAKENKSLLIFDEADSFLRDRATASHSWEISGVNEMLTWMESHPYPFICTTNLMDTLDPASLRRFSFKVKYEFLNTAQVQTAFEHFFGVKVSVQDVASLATLTPGDFALVKNKAEILGVLKQPEKLKELLQTEQKVKMQHTTSQIGFCPR